MNARTVIGGLVCTGFALVAGCDKGIAPDTPSAAPAEIGSISGTVTFLHWEAVDTVYDTRIVAFRSFPPGDIINDVLQGKAALHPPLGGPALAEAGADTVAYQFQLGAGTYPYLVVAFQFGPSVFTDWLPAGQYDLDTNLTDPSPVTILPNDTTTGIDILVDFENLPPIP